MELKEYQNLARQTVVYPKQMANEYLSFGLFSEVGELHETYLEGSRTDLIREMGDVMWYLVNLLWENGFVAIDLPLGKIRQGPDEQMMQLCADASKFGDWMKKGIRDWRQLVRQEVKEAVGACVHGIERICMLKGISFQEVLEVNVEKLFGRKENGSLHGSGDYR